MVVTSKTEYNNKQPECNICTEVPGVTWGKNKKQKLNFLENFCLGGINGGISKTLFAPLERIKLLLQNQHILKNLNVKYNGNIDCLIRVTKEQGFISFWRGNTANIVRYVPSFAINFSLKEKFHIYFENLTKNKDQNTNLKIYINLISGFFAAAFSIIGTYPLDFARTKIGVDVTGKDTKNKKYKGIIDCIVKNYKYEGLRGIYQGLVICIIGGSIYRSLYFGLYDSIKIFFPEEKTHFLTLYMFSVITTGVAGCITLPLDTIRQRLMIQTGESKKMYNSSLNCAKTIYKQENLKGFWKGGYANFFRSFGSAFTLFFNDTMLKKYLDYKNN